MIVLNILLIITRPDAGLYADSVSELIIDAWDRFFLSSLISKKYFFEKDSVSHLMLPNYSTIIFV